MEKIIACCGLNCVDCDARKATLADDNKLRAETAEKWRVQFGVAGILPEMINCTGCREEGVKISHCAECEIRNCVIGKGYKTCADCDLMEDCSILSPVLQYSPESLENLRSLN